VRLINGFADRNDEAGRQPDEDGSCWGRFCIPHPAFGVANVRAAKQVRPELIANFLFLLEKTTFISRKF
jgi:hypothetical protein